MSRKTGLRLLSLGVGAGLLGMLLREADLRDLAAQVLNFGALGAAVVLLLYLVEFVADTLSWQMTILSAPLSPTWVKRLFLVRMVGEALNSVTPLAGIGGEPVKAVLLKKYYRVSYSESSASLVLAKTVNMLTLIAFLSGGYYLLRIDSRFSAPAKSLAALSLVAFVIAIAAFFLFQQWRMSSAIGEQLSHWRYGHRLATAIHHIREFDDRLSRFYTGHGGRFSAALLFALSNWFMGALGVYWTMVFLALPVSFLEAWMIEASAQLVRAGTFFIPANIGTQEGIYVVMFHALTGNPTAGLAAAVIRRFRELVWILAGLGVGWLYSIKPTLSEGPRHEPAD